MNKTLNSTKTLQDIHTNENKIILLSPQSEGYERHENFHLIEFKANHTIHYSDAKKDDVKDYFFDNSIVINKASKSQELAEDIIQLENEFLKGENQGMVNLFIDASSVSKLFKAEDRNARSSDCEGLLKAIARRIDKFAPSIIAHDSPNRNFKVCSIHRRRGTDYGIDTLSKAPLKMEGNGEEILERLHFRNVK